jgi:hypothetical protein
MGLTFSDRWDDDDINKCADCESLRLLLGRSYQKAEEWRVLNQRRLVALESVEWIMVNGRVQCPSCLHSKEEGHGILCLIDEALRPTAQKLKLREEQESMYAACRFGK